MRDFKLCDLKGIRLPDGTTYICPERCSIPRWVCLLHPAFSANRHLSAAIRSMGHIPAMLGSAHRHVNSVDGIVANSTFMGLPGERATCVG